MLQRAALSVVVCACLAMGRWPRSNGGSSTRKQGKIQPGADRDSCSSTARQASHTRGSPWATLGRTICLLSHRSGAASANAPSCRGRSGLPSALSNGRRGHWRLKTPLLQLRTLCSRAAWPLLQWSRRDGADSPLTDTWTMHLRVSCQLHFCTHTTATGSIWQ